MLFFSRKKSEKVNLPVNTMLTTWWRKGHEGGYFGKFSKPMGLRGLLPSKSFQSNKCYCFSNCNCVAKSTQSCYYGFFHFFGIKRDIELPWWNLFPVWIAHGACHHSDCSLIVQSSLLIFFQQEDSILLIHMIF